jgi:hypothetical protein
MLLLLAVVAALEPAGVPLPRPRPPIPAVATQTPHGPPTACDKRLAEVAEFTLKPTLSGPGQCGGEDLVSLSAVRLAKDQTVAVQPPALLRCEMAETVANWVREDAAPRFASIGELAAVAQDDAYECRYRNRAADGKISEHAHGLALDVHAFVLADGRPVSPTDINQPKDLRLALRDTACGRFTTVLGPGQPAHDSHIHLDMIQRRSGYRICEWDVREPLMAKASATIVPLPTPRPFIRATSGSR